MEPLCKPCEKAGITRKAHYYTNPPTCRECYQKRSEKPVQNSVTARLEEIRAEHKGELRRKTSDPPEAMEPEDLGVKPEEEEFMDKRGSKIDWGNAQRDRSNGMSVPTLAKKYGVSQASIYVKTRRLGKKPVKEPGTIQQENYGLVGSVHHGNVTLVPVPSLLEKWNHEANEVFAALPLEKKAELLASLG